MKLTSSFARLGAGVALLLPIVAVAATSPAAAGTNGQHVEACSGYHTVIGASMWGTDQNGNFAETPRRDFPYAYSVRQCDRFDDYWFKGNITVRWYRSDGTTTETHEYIPVSQASDWKTVHLGQY
ncbi:hypothetical protein ACIA49_33370 [Kribbella sp. NPDC051587]|uniref:hypothetical protein n=1 Tax=Kribbella sp. NPDC051587 TaxID=3364119 RepID=UPI00378E54DF